MNIITSRTNETIKNAAKLSADAALRRREGLFFLEGLRLCCDAAGNKAVLKSAFVTNSAAERHTGELQELLSVAEETFLITEEIALKLSDTKSPQGVFCICEIPKGKAEPNYGGRYIAAENIQTPGNLGAIARTAEAFGIDGMIISGGCDIYNLKAQRAAMGALLRLPVFEAETLEDFIRDGVSHGMSAYAAVPQPDALPITSMNKSGGIICAVGNEGNGLSEAVTDCCEKITIPMRGRAESLNAAAAAAVIMWEMVR